MVSGMMCIKLIGHVVFWRDIWYVIVFTSQLFTVVFVIDIIDIMKKCWLNWQYNYHSIHTVLGPSARNISVRAEWLRQSRCTPSEQSEIPRWQPTPRQAPIQCVALHLALWSRFAVSSPSVGMLLSMKTVVLWPTVTIRRNGWIGYISKM